MGVVRVPGNGPYGGNRKFGLGAGNGCGPGLDHRWGRDRRRHFRVRQCRIGDGVRRKSDHRPTGLGSFTGISTDALLGSGNAGSVQVTVAREASIVNGGSILTRTYPTSTGNAGSIDLTVGGQASILNGSAISSSTFGPGNGGSVTASAGSLAIDGQGSPLFTGITSQASARVNGNCGSSAGYGCGPNVDRRCGRNKFQHFRARQSGIGDGFHRKSDDRRTRRDREPGRTVNRKCGRSAGDGRGSRFDFQRRRDQFQHVRVRQCGNGDVFSRKLDDRRARHFGPHRDSKRCRTRSTAETRARSRSPSAARLPLSTTARSVPLRPRPAMPGRWRFPPTV